eukprot:1699675-Pleurochrysis_carterae.AAC.1
MLPLKRTHPPPRRELSRLQKENSSASKKRTHPPPRRELIRLQEEDPAATFARVAARLRRGLWRLDAHTASHAPTAPPPTLSRTRALPVHRPQRQLRARPTAEAHAALRDELRAVRDAQTGARRAPTQRWPCVGVEKQSPC